MPSACVDESVPSLTEANDSDNGNLKVSSNTSSLQVRNRAKFCLFSAPANQARLHFRAR
jgi:hypothetical protein